MQDLPLSEFIWFGFVSCGFQEVLYDDLQKLYS